MIVMAPFALALFEADIPAILKYPILAVATSTASNGIVFASSRAVGGVGSRESRLQPG